MNSPKKPCRPPTSTPAASSPTNRNTGVPSNASHLSRASQTRDTSATRAPGSQSNGMIRPPTPSSTMATVSSGWLRASISTVGGAGAGATGGEFPPGVSPPASTDPDGGDSPAGVPGGRRPAGRWPSEGYPSNGYPSEGYPGEDGPAGGGTGDGGPAGGGPADCGPADCGPAGDRKSTRLNSSPLGTSY